MSLDLETRRKRLRYRASHTGTRETNILFGGFIAEHGASLDSEIVAQAEQLLGANDIEIVNWIMGRTPVPENYDTELMARLKDYAVGRHEP